MNTERHPSLSWRHGISAERLLRDSAMHSRKTIIQTLVLAHRRPISLSKRLDVGLPDKQPIFLQQSGCIINYRKWNIRAFGDVQKGMFAVRQVENP